DAEDLPFPDHHFDLITCRFGVMFFSDPAKALREAQRVLKKDGRACFLVWGAFDQPYWSTTMGIVQKHIGGPAIAPGGADPFRFSTSGSLSKALQKAGFSSIDEEPRSIPWNWPGPVEEVWEYARSVSTPFRPLLDRIHDDQWPAIDADVHNAISPY